MAELPLIELRKVSKFTGPLWERKAVLSDISMKLRRGENHAILTLRDTTVPSSYSLMSIISGLGRPSVGRVTVRGRICAPLSMTTQIAPFKTPRELAIFLSRIYEADPRHVVGYATDFAQVSAKAMSSKIGTLTTEERIKIGYAIGFALPAEMYCFQNGIYWGDDEFQNRCKQAFSERRAHAATLVTTDNVRNVAEIADAGSILHKTRLFTFPTIEEAITAFNRIKLLQEEASLTHLRELVRAGEVHWMSEYLDNVSPSGVGVAEKHTILAELALQHRRYDEAVRAAQIALNDGGPHEKLTVVMAKAAEASGDHEEAVALLERISVEDASTASKVMLARNVEKLGQIGRAGLIWKSIFMESANGVARQRAEVCLLKVEDWPELLRLAEHTLSTAPQNVPALELRFKALLKMRSWRQTVSVVRATASFNLAKALGMIYQAVQTDDWPVATLLVKCLPKDRELEIGDERLLLLTVALFKRRSHSASKGGEKARAAAADEAIRSLGRMAPSKVPN